MSCFVKYDSDRWKTGHEMFKTLTTTHCSETYILQLETPLLLLIYVHLSNLIRCSVFSIIRNPVCLCAPPPNELTRYIFMVAFTDYISIHPSTNSARYFKSHGTRPFEPTCVGQSHGKSHFCCSHPYPPKRKDGIFR